MNTKSLLATLLVLGSSTAALAQPAVRDHRDGYSDRANVRDRSVVGDRSNLRDHRNDGWDRDRDRERLIVAPVIVTPPVDACANVRVGAKASAYTGPVGLASRWGGWALLAEPTMIGSGSEQITVGKDHGKFTQLQLVANSGSTYISQVVVEFGNGKYQTVALNQQLDAGNPALTIDLKGNRRAISRIIVEGTSSYGARYSVRAA